MSNLQSLQVELFDVNGNYLDASSKIKLGAVCSRFRTIFYNKNYWKRNPVKCSIYFTEEGFNIYDKIFIETKAYDALRFLFDLITIRNLKLGNIRCDVPQLRRLFEVILKYKKNDVFAKLSEITVSFFAKLFG